MRATLEFFRSGVCVGLGIKGWDPLLTEPHAIYQHFVSLMCSLRRTDWAVALPLTVLEGGGGRVGGMHNFRYEISCFFNKYLRVTPLSRGNGTNYNRGSRSFVRSSVKQ